MCYVILIGDTFHRKTGAHSIIAIETHKGATFPGTVLIPQVPGTSAEQRGVTMLLTLIALIKPTDISKRTRIHFPSVVIDVFGSSTSYNGRALELRTVTARSEGASYRLTGIGQMDPPNEVLYLLESLVGAMLAHQDHGHRVGHSRDLRHCPCVSSAHHRDVDKRSTFRSTGPPSAARPTRPLGDYTSPLTNTRFTARTLANRGNETVEPARLLTLSDPAISDMS